MNVFVSGGAKNGKSGYAQDLAVKMAKGGRPLYYIATMIATDSEDELRIERHIEDRKGLGFNTIERGRNIRGLFDDVSLKTNDAISTNGVFLVDSVTALLANEMFNTEIDEEAPIRVARDLVLFANTTGNTIFVSDYIYSYARHFDKYTEAYISGLAYVDRELARVCDSVVELSFLHITHHKGNKI